MKNNLFMPTDILLPAEKPEKWAVIACDQYTSEPEYWENVRKTAGDAPSAFNIIFPEAFLGKNNAEKISKINSVMKSYLEGGVFKEYKNTFVYTERTLKNGKTRRGIIGLINLDNYSYEKGSKALIRATEATVKERIPARVEIRRGAYLEMPHVMLLCDDPENLLIGGLQKSIDNFECLYDFDLMCGGGHIRGFAPDKAAAEALEKHTEELLRKNGGDMLFVVGDGNHSLAAAKECAALGGSHYALVEVVNIHDDSLEFEPIYRVLFGVEPEKVVEDFTEKCGGEYRGADAQRFRCVYGSTEKEISVRPASKLAVGTLQAYLDDYLKAHKGAEIDYIHGENSLKKLAETRNALGFLFDGMKKEELFDAVRQDGSLPRKTFSMGEADDKRFYLECRKL